MVGSISGQQLPVVGSFQPGIQGDNNTPKTGDSSRSNIGDENPTVEVSDTRPVERRDENRNASPDRNYDSGGLSASGSDRGGNLDISV